jgi:hypothetical protein
MAQQRLFRLAVEAVHLTAVHTGADGWRLTVGYRRQDEPWSSAYRVDYDHLSSSELADIVGEEIARALGIL